MIAWLLASMALGVEPDEQALRDALQAELARGVEELALPDSPRIYHLRYKWITAREVTVDASLGALLEIGDTPSNALGVEVRVGDPSYDNTGMGGWRDGFAVARLGQVPTVQSARQDAWRVTDRAYKDAVEQLGRKRAQVVRPDDFPGDYTLTGPQREEGREGRSGASAALIELAIALSEPLVDVPGIEVGSAFVGHEAGSLWILDSEGTEVRRPVEETSVRVVAHVRLADGSKLTDQRLWMVRTVEELPDVERMRAEVEAMAGALVARAEADAFDGEYVGPVLFEEGAAADLFRWLLLPQLQGTPPVVPFDSFIGEIGAEGTGARLRRRVLPEGWRVVDDPQADPRHPGAFTHDWEGTPAQRVVVVEDGIVRALLTTRVPRTDQPGSNGHGRGTLSGRAEGMPSLTEVRPDKTLSERALRKRALRAAAAYGLDHVLVVRRFQHPALRDFDDADAGWGGDRPVLPPPVEVVRLFADGREEVLRGARFASVDRWALRDIVAAGGLVEHDYLSAWDGDDSSLGPTQGVPAHLIAPAVLIGELEILADPGDPARAHRLAPPPLASRQTPGTETK